MQEGNKNRYIGGGSRINGGHHADEKEEHHHSMFQYQCRYQGCYHISTYIGIAEDNYKRNIYSKDAI